MTFGILCHLHWFQQQLAAAQCLQAGPVHRIPLCGWAASIASVFISETERCSFMEKCWKAPLSRSTQGTVWLHHFDCPHHEWKGSFIYFYLELTSLLSEYIPSTHCPVLGSEQQWHMEYFMPLAPTYYRVKEDDGRLSSPRTNASECLSSWTPGPDIDSHHLCCRRPH